MDSMARKSNDAKYSVVSVLEAIGSNQTENSPAHVYLLVDVLQNIKVSNE